MLTEEEWYASSDPSAVLRPAINDSLSDSSRNRKAILFAAACCERVHMNGHSRVDKQAVQWLLTKADGEREPQEKQAILRSLERASKRRLADRDALIAIRTAVSETRISNFYASVFMAAKLISRAIARGDKLREDEEDRVHCDLLRCIFGNPFHPITLSNSYLTSTVLSLAQQMYDSRDFSAMPILADALQDAGCDDADILNHCRGTGPHCRGCFVVDLILDKQ